MAYAAGTDVPVERSKSQIEALLIQRGADQFYSAWEKGRAMIAFRHSGRMVRLEIPMPDPEDPKIVRDRAGRPKRNPEAALEAEHRRRWRALLLIVKAKFEAMEAGITSFEEEFLSSVIMADGQTIYSFLRPQLAAMYQSGRAPSLLPSVAQKG